MKAIKFLVRVAVFIGMFCILYTILPSPTYSIDCQCCPCNTDMPPPEAFSLTTLQGDVSKSANRLDIFFIGDGYSAEQQDIFNEAVNIIINHLQLEPTYSDYFGFFNIHRVNVISPEYGMDICQAGWEYPIHHLVFDDEDPAVFTSTGPWIEVVSENSFEGNSYHVLPYEPSAPSTYSATWSFTVPDTLGQSSELQNYAPWQGSSENTDRAKYTIKKNGIVVQTWIKNQRTGKGNFIYETENLITGITYNAGDYFEITVENDGVGHLVADSIFLFNYRESVPVPYCRDTYFNNIRAVAGYSYVDWPKITDFLMSNYSFFDFDSDIIFVLLNTTRSGFALFRGTSHPAYVFMSLSFPFSNPILPSVMSCLFCGGSLLITAVGA